MAEVNTRSEEASAQLDREEADLLAARVGEASASSPTIVPSVVDMPMEVEVSARADNAVEKEKAVAPAGPAPIVTTEEDPRDATDSESSDDDDDAPKQKKSSKSKKPKTLIKNGYKSTPVGDCEIGKSAHCRAGGSS